MTIKRQGNEMHQARQDCLNRKIYTPPHLILCDAILTLIRKEINC